MGGTRDSANFVMAVPELDKTVCPCYCSDVEAKFVVPGMSGSSSSGESTEFDETSLSLLLSLFI